MLEVEVKVKISAPEAERVLKRLGFVYINTVHERDVYYNGEKKDLKKEDKALRIRETENKQTEKREIRITYKGPKIDDSTMTREETEFVLPSFESGDAMLQGLGFFPAGVVEKERMAYKKESTRCFLDKVTDLGEFLEIEIMAENVEEYHEAVDKIDEILGCMGITRTDTIKTSYLTLLERKRIWQS